MTTDTVLVRPWPGLILDGIPSTGAALPRDLADMWIADRLVVRVTPPPVITVTKLGDTRPARRRSSSHG